MAAVSWKGGSGNWTDSNWAGTATYPGASDNVSVSVAGAYTLTINSAVAAHSFTLNDSSATIADNGTLTLSGANPTLTLTAGAFDLAGSIVGGTIKDAGSRMVFAGGTLSGVTY